MKFSEKIARKFKQSKFKIALDKFWYWKSNISKLKYLLFVYFVIILISSLLLFSPWTQNLSPENEKISYLDAVFTTASAFSDTGLVVKNTFSHWNIFGQGIITILILFGGIGFFALKFFVITYIFRRRSSSLGDMMLIQTERGSTEERKTSRLIISSVKFLFITIFIFSIILSLYFYFTDIKTTSSILNSLNNEYINPKGNWGLAIRFGIFHTISAINNAGFDIISGKSLSPYYKDYFLQFCFIVLLIIGGIGYPVIYDLRCFILHKMRRKSRRYRFTLFTKVSLIMYLIVFLVGFISTSLFELLSQDPNSFWNRIDVSQANEPIKVSYNNYLEALKTNTLSESLKKFPELKNYYYYGNSFNKIFAIFFTSLSTRSAGFATFDLADLTKPSITIYTIMMVIGAAPASTGGGIRTTTFALFVMSIFSILAGWPRVRMFKRAINKDTVSMSSHVIGIALVILSLATLICATTLLSHNLEWVKELNNGNLDVKKFGMGSVLFEVASAFGTTGLSTGITQYLNATAKITLIVVMFVGQFGISSTLLVWKRKKNNSRKFEYVDGDIAIG
ncbi:TrkH family potassium uptake protein [Mycoplasmopsis glycophila]|uniref:Ktr system potassium uptake protein B n=1 Tax=Mycoplasmopsis glycophila TaxID=171285 RepID=A0A449AUY7_9BACT|nr:potassium transporter TrkG [Mycoplasmopsis glycophila]VEU70303.1 Ktr system potassium uptake protein B [Mycoplasmopsis glycophila]